MKAKIFPSLINPREEDEEEKIILSLPPL